MGKQDGVRIKHVWNPISIQDFVDIAKPVADLYANKVIDRKTAYDLLNLDYLLMKAEESALTKQRRPPAQKSIADFELPPSGETEVKLK
jgi:hypothetical protein